MKPFPASRRLTNVAARLSIPTVLLLALVSSQLRHNLHTFCQATLTAHHNGSPGTGHSVRATARLLVEIALAHSNKTWKLFNCEVVVIVLPCSSEGVLDIVLKLYGLVVHVVHL